MQSNPDKLRNDSVVPSNLAAVHTANASEILINGVLQGRPQLDPRGASCVSRRKMWYSAIEIAETVRDVAAQGVQQDIQQHLTEVCRGESQIDDQARS